MKVLSVSGTCPEALGRGPLLKALGEAPRIESIVCTTVQHRAMPDRVALLAAVFAGRTPDAIASRQMRNGLASIFPPRIPVGPVGTDPCGRPLPNPVPAVAAPAVPFLLFSK